MTSGVERRSRKKLTKEGLFLLLMRYVSFSSSLYLTIAGFTYFWKEIFLPAKLSGRIFWILLPALIVLAMLIGETLFRRFEKNRQVLIHRSKEKNC